MTKKNVYLWCSGPTDQTGSLLADKLKISWGTKKPDLKSLLLLIGWGTKTKEATNLGKLLTINHPNNIRENRNKWNALKLMEKEKVAVPRFVTADVIIKKITDKTMSFPIIGRTKFHQGGKGLWVCPALGQIHTAIAEGAYYFQSMVDVKTEYRLHVFGDEVIYAVKKVQRTKEEMKKAFVDKELKRQKALAEKSKDNNFDEGLVKKVLQRQAQHAITDHLVRSNTRGWRFSRITKYDTELKTNAIKAVKALGLNFGAVDCCMDTNGDVWIIEVNTGPGLEGAPLDAYVNKFAKTINNMLNPKPSDAIIDSVLSAQNRKIRKNKTDLRVDLASRTALMSEMIEKANDVQLTALKSVFGKMFN